MKDNGQADYCDFYGVVLRAIFTNPQDRDDFRFFYADFLTDPREDFDLEIRFHAKDGTTLRHLLADPKLSYASYRLRGSACFVPWNQASTIIPPFLLPPLRGRFLLLHGAAVTKRAGRCTLIMAPHYQGKTSLTLMLVLRRSFRYLTEDLILLESCTGLVYPLNKPAGIRHGTLNTLPELRDLLGACVEQREYISHVTGPISIVKIACLKADSFQKGPQGVKTIVFPADRGRECRPTRIAALTPAECLKKLTQHRFKTGIPLVDEMRQLLYLSREAKAYSIEYDLSSPASLEEAGRMLDDL
jgi:hypothetical protein